MQCAVSVCRCRRESAERCCVAHLVHRYGNLNARPAGSAGGVVHFISLTLSSSFATTTAAGCNAGRRSTIFVTAGTCFTLTVSISQHMQCPAGVLARFSDTVLCVRLSIDASCLLRQPLPLRLPPQGQRSNELSPPPLRSHCQHLNSSPPSAHRRRQRAGRDKLRGNHHQYTCRLLSPPLHPIHPSIHPPIGLVRAVQLSCDEARHEQRDKVRQRKSRGGSGGGVGRA